VAHHSVELLPYAPAHTIAKSRDPADVFQEITNTSIVPISGQLSQPGRVLSTEEVKDNGLETQAIG